MGERGNAAGRYLLCSVTNEDGKKHKLFFHEGRVLISGWMPLVDNLRGLGGKASLENRLHGQSKLQMEEEYPRGGLTHGFSYAETKVFLRSQYGWTLVIACQEGRI